MEKHYDSSILSLFPAADTGIVDALLREAVEMDQSKIVVLDDDPTGVQTVHDISVYTQWDEESIRRGFAEKNKMFYILTNSRGMTKRETAECHREIAGTIARISGETGKKFMIMSRSDSTLRGHYPLETEVLREELAQNGIRTDGEILCPFFQEGGRFTFNNIHYVKQEDELVPAAETEFARDLTFGYRHSSIPEYIEEKTGGAYPADSVTCISLESLRNMDLDGIEAQLNRVCDFNKICVNAVSYEDVKVFAVALYRSVAKGKHFLFRTAAGLVKAVGYVSDRPLLTKKEMSPDLSENGGLVIVGSYTGKTTRQLEELLKSENVIPVEFDSDKVLDGGAALDSEVDRCVRIEEEKIQKGSTVVCYTKRKLLSLPEDTEEGALQRSVKISEGVQKLVGLLKVRPAFVIAKGGITSSDIGTKALRVKRADVLGQILPGVPVWKLGEESKFPGMPYIIFPGNTGDRNSLCEAVERLSE